MEGNPRAQSANWNKMIEMDRFVHTLQGHRFEKIERKSVDSSAIMNNYDTNNR